MQHLIQFRRDFVQIVAQIITLEHTIYKTLRDEELEPPEYQACMDLHERLSKAKKILNEKEI